MHEELYLILEHLLHDHPATLVEEGGGRGGEVIGEGAGGKREKR